MLKIRNLHAYYGDIEALKGLTMEVKEGAITCLVGKNGAGKSTLLKAISAWSSAQARFCIKRRRN